jgi:hypothetical protein
MYMGVLSHIEDPEETYRLIRATMAPLAAGNHLVVWDDIETDSGQRRASEGYSDIGAEGYYSRTPEEIATCFAGLELVEPGLVSITSWRPDPGDPGTVEGGAAQGAVARKPCLGVPWPDVSVHGSGLPYLPKRALCSRVRGVGG